MSITHKPQLGNRLGLFVKKSYDIHSTRVVDDYKRVMSELDMLNDYQLSQLSHWLWQGMWVLYPLMFWLLSRYHDIIISLILIYAHLAYHITHISLLTESLRSRQHSPGHHWVLTGFTRASLKWWQHSPWQYWNGDSIHHGSTEMVTAFTRVSLRWWQHSPWQYRNGDSIHQGIIECWQHSPWHHWVLTTFTRASLRWWQHSPGHHRVAMAFTRASLGWWQNSPWHNWVVIAFTRAWLSGDSIHQDIVEMVTAFTRALHPLHVELDESTARRQLKSPRSISGRSIHLTSVTKWSRSWSWMTYCHTLCAMSIGPPILRYSYLTMKIHGQGHVCGQRSRSRLTFKFQRSRLWSRSNPLVTFEALSSIAMFAFRFVAIGPLLAEI